VPAATFTPDPAAGDHYAHIARDGNGNARSHLNQYVEPDRHTVADRHQHSWSAS
jgi:hypothetical protein